MKKIIAACLSLLCLHAANAQAVKPAEIKREMKRVADWQIAHFRDAYSRNEPHHPADWTNAALYVGMVKWASMADTNIYFNWLRNIGDGQNWQLHKRKYMADDHAVGQMYIALYRKYRDTTMLTGTKNRFDSILEAPSQASLAWGAPNQFDRWSWCDALFMAPPVWAALADITGDHQYSEFMLKEYKTTYNLLFDEKENLFYRDERFIDSLDHGRKIFWSRGNGWVFAGLALLMDEYKPGSVEYQYFLSIYKRMADKIASLQTAEGHWPMSLLAADIYPTPETSGTGFFTYGLAWGINNGILPRKKYAPIVLKGWKSLVSHVTSSGMLGYVQPIGAAPGDAWADKTEVYGVGAFLAAGSEVYKMIAPK